MLWIRQIYTLSKLTVLENLRKQVLQVVLILTIGAIASTSLLSFFDMGVQIKILKDLSLAAILFSGGVMAIALSAGSLPGELANRTAYPLLARPIRRSDFLLAKYLGTLATCFLCMVLIGIVFVGMLRIYEHRFDTAVLTGMSYIFLEVAVVASVGFFFSMLVSPMVAATLTFGVFILGQIKVVYLHHAIERSASVASATVLKFVYYLVPNLDSFSFKDALVHGIPIPESYLWLVAFYGLVYCAFIIAASGAVFSRKEL